MTWTEEKYVIQQQTQIQEHTNKQAGICFQINTIISRTERLTNSTYIIFTNSFRKVKVLPSIKLILPNLQEEHDI